MLNCEVCNKEVKNQGGLNLHMRSHLPKTTTGAVELPRISPVNSTPTVTAPLPTPTVVSCEPKKVTFYSVKRPSMQVVVVADRWRIFKTHDGAEQLIQVQGKTVTFEMGQYVTDDLEIINYLENVYKDARFPILSSRQMAAMRAS